MCTGISGIRSPTSTPPNCWPNVVSGGCQWQLALGAGLCARAEQTLPTASKPTNKSYRIDETYIKVRGEDKYLYRGKCCVCTLNGATQEGSRSATMQEPVRCGRPSLAVQVAPRNPEHLAFSYHLGCFDSLNHRPRRFRRPWPLHRAQPALDVTVIGFDPIITVAARSLAATARQATLGLLPDCGWITAHAITGEDVREPVVGIGQCFLQKQLGSFAVPCFGEVEVYRPSVAIDGTEQVFPLAGSPNKRLIHVPSGRFSLNLAAQPPINLGGRKPEPNARSKCGRRPHPAPP